MTDRKPRDVKTKSPIPAVAGTVLAVDQTRTTRTVEWFPDIVAATAYADERAKKTHRNVYLFSLDRVIGQTVTELPLADSE